MNDGGNMDEKEKKKKMKEYTKKILAWAKTAEVCIWCNHPVQWNNLFNLLKCEGCGLEVRDTWANTKIDKEW